MTQIEKIRAEIVRLKEKERPFLSEFENGCIQGNNVLADDLLSFLDILEAEGLHSELDDAAEIAKELAFKTWSEGENWSDAAIKTFKAGAKWMAEQGFIMGTTFRISDDENPFVNFEDHNGSKEQSMKLLLNRL